MQRITKNKQLNQPAGETEALRQQVITLETQLATVYSSSSWRITAPLRAAYRGLRWFLRNARRALKPLWWLGTDQFRRAANALLPYYRRYVPLRVRQMVPYRARVAFYQRLLKNDVPLAEYATPDIHYVPLLNGQAPLRNPAVRLVAFYLPQFHQIPENDAFWGEGFTDWTNVRAAKPQFVGHYQPRVPGELGYYDLLDTRIQQRQVELAKLYDVGGFCFHFYWFNGKRPLEKPVENYLNDVTLDLPFCLCWANENWTRRWDGRENEVLIAQNHSAEDDLALIAHISKYLRDPRYIRIDAKPLLIVYRPSLLPSAKKTARRWRTWCRNNGIGEIYLALTHAFEHLDPRTVGFDAAVEFAPNTFPLTDIKDKFDLANLSFQGHIYDYREALELAKKYSEPPYRKFRSLCPSWDNEARKPGRGTILANASPAAYGEWLKMLCEWTITNSGSEERLIFVNAWNEWAEGAYLEPDQGYGYSYLSKTAEVLSSFPRDSETSPGRWKILFVSHDACKGGAQSVLINIISWFRRHTFADVRILCLESGEWLPRFKELGPTVVLSELSKKATSEDDIVQKLRNLCGGAPSLIYGNSVASGRQYRLLCQLNAPIVTHFHELEMSMRRYAEDCISDVSKYSSHFIACSGAVRENLVKNHEVDKSRITTVYSSISTETLSGRVDPRDKEVLRRKLKIEKKKCLIFGCGFGMPFRKGADLFIEAARLLRRKGLDGFHFYWVGDFDPNESDDRYGSWSDYLASLRNDRLKRYVTFLGVRDNVREYLQSGDIFFLPSREDPFPLVALEAAECGLPIVCFADGGGIPEFVQEDAGLVVPHLDVGAAAEKLAFLIENRDLATKLGIRARDKMLSSFTFEHTTPHILSLCRRVAKKKPTVSVIVPNYNHARYLPRRLDSIFSQTFRDFEVILLDDASTDNSVQIMEAYARHDGVRIVVNKENSGSPFKQWLKGIDLAQGDILWIAESDDLCEPQFLETLVPAFSDPSVRLAYCDSYVIDENDIVKGDYLGCEYLTSLSQTKWTTNYQTSATEEINDGLGVKNTILNISAVLLRNLQADMELRQTLESMRIAGDWFFIAHAIKGGQIHYMARKLNCHRRHSESVIAKTVTGRQIEDFFRELSIVHQFIVANYPLAPDFPIRWETYLHQQWHDFCPERPSEELEKYYPLGALKQRILINAEQKNRVL